MKRNKYENLQEYNVHRTKGDTILAYSPGILAGEIPVHVLHTHVISVSLSRFLEQEM